MHHMAMIFETSQMDQLTECDQIPGPMSHKGMKLWKVGAASVLLAAAMVMWSSFLMA